MAISLQARERPIVAGVAAARRFPLLVAVISVLAVAVSATGSWVPSLWGDEAASVMSATRSVPSLFDMLGSVDAVHGTYYLALHAWIDLFGASPFSVRLPSALAVGAVVAGVMLIARRLGTVRLAVAAGIICAVIPRVTFAGEEARSSAAAAAIVVWLTLILLEILARRTPSARWWAAYAALLGVGIYVFLYVVLIAAAHAVVLLSIRADRRLLTRWGLSVGAAVLAAGPLFLEAVRERSQIAFLAHRDVITVAKITVGLWFGQPLFAVAAWALLGVALVAGAASWRSGRGSVAGPTSQRGVAGAGDRMPRLDVVAASWLLVPAVILIGGFPVLPVYTARYLTYCAPAAALLMAVGLEWAARRRPRVLAAGVVVVVLCALPAWIAQRQPNSKNNSDFAETSAIIGAHASPGDAIAFDESVRPSRRPRLALHLYPSDFTAVRDVTLHVPFSRGTSWHDTAYDIGDAEAHGRLDGVRRLWLVEYARPGKTDHYDQSELARLGFAATRAFDTHRSVIYEYVLRGT